MIFMMRDFTLHRENEGYFKNKNLADLFNNIQKVKSLYVMDFIKNI